jgi:hypothetical protein
MYGSLIRGAKPSGYSGRFFHAFCLLSIVDSAEKPPLFISWAGRGSPMPFVECLDSTPLSFIYLTRGNNVPVFLSQRTVR